jgi:xanthine dehydrogenase accessory factor
VHTVEGVGGDAGKGGAAAMIKGQLARTAERLVADREPFVLATVVRAKHPTSVRPGDTAIVRTDGTIEGFVGGACAQSAVRLHGLRVLETREPLLLSLIPGNPEDPDGELPGAGEGVIVEHNPCLSGGSLEIFLEPQLPAPRIAVLGSSPFAVAIEEVAAAAGFEVVRGATEDVRAEPGDAALVVASHGAGEEDAITAALTAGVPYVALVASRRRGEAVRSGLSVADELRAQLHTPAGLDIGARTPKEVAVSILAELIAARRSAPPQAWSAPATAADPVCGMEVAVSDATPSLEIAGERFFFCGEGCKETYAKRHAARV